MINKKLTILIPYRNREEHLIVFIPYMRNYMKTNFPNIIYDIVIIEQGNDKPFNRGLLLNIGYLITSSNTDYYALHDIDILPISSDYSYHEEPQHLFVNAFEQKVDGTLYNHNRDGLYKNKGCVLTVSKELYKLVNGHSVNYWGWGLEDDDFSFRLFDAGHHLERYGYRMNHGGLENNDLGYYIMLNSENVSYNKNPYYEDNYYYACDIISRKKDWRIEGLNTTPYKIVEKIESDGYTKYIIDFDIDAEQKNELKSIIK